MAKSKINPVSKTKRTYTKKSLGRIFASTPAPATPGLLGKIGKFAGKHPIATAAGVAGLVAEFGPGLISGSRETFRSLRGEDPTVEGLLQSTRQGAVFQAMQARKAEHLRRLREQNSARLLQFAPHVANQLLAGRKLPQDAVVIGGTPRVDLLNEVASRMSRGEFPNDGRGPLSAGAMMGAPMGGGM